MDLLYPEVLDEAHALSPPSKLWNSTLLAKGNMIIMKDTQFFLIALICVCHLYNQSFNYFAIYAIMQE